MKPVNVPAKNLADPRYRKRVVRSKKTYTRKGRAARKGRALSPEKAEAPERLKKLLARQMGRLERGVDYLETRQKLSSVNVIDLPVRDSGSLVEYLFAGYWLPAWCFSITKDEVASRKRSIAKSKKIIDSLNERIAKAENVQATH